MNTKQKALQINTNRSIYGTFAEIGAGQEVARHFFQAGAASGTVAKSMSAYDMHVSDEIYGVESSGRYVCESRLVKMLQREFDLLVKRLQSKRTEPTAFFVLADTVATRAVRGKGLGHGWMGVRFQASPGEEPSQLNIHLRLMDRTTVHQQNVIGKVGVNLLFGCFFFHRNPKKLVNSLFENTAEDHVEIDMIRFQGPAFEGVDNRLMSIELVQGGMTEAVMFQPDGKVVQPAEVLYKKNVLAIRGSFRPFTNTNLDMITQGKALLERSQKVNDPVLVVTEISMNNLLDDKHFNKEDFLARVDCIAAMGYHVLITTYKEYFRLSAFLNMHTKKAKAFVLGARHLERVFDAEYYKDLPGGLMESLGVLFQDNGQLLVYPSKIEGKVVTCENLRLPEENELLFKYCLQNTFVKDIDGYHEACLSILSAEALRMIKSGDARWETQVPEEVCKIIKERNLFQ